LAGAVESALQQTFRDLEVIVVDDGSTDDTAAVMNHYAGDPRVSYHRAEHAGVAAAKSAGICRARAPFVAFLDADDEWLPRKLQQQMPLFQTDPDLAVVYARRLLMDHAGQPLPYRQPALHRGHVLEPMFQQNFVCFSTAVVRRAVFDQVGLFDDTLPFGVDYDLWLRIAIRFRFDFVDEPLVRYRTGHARLSCQDTERTVLALRIMERFLDNGGRAALKPAAVRRAFAMTHCHIALGQRDSARAAACASVLKSLANAPGYWQAWKVLASLALPGHVREWLARLREAGAGSIDTSRPVAPLTEPRAPALLRLPWLLWRGVRWHGLRGSWLPRHLLERRAASLTQLGRDTPIDVLVLIVDHFEPRAEEGDAIAVDAVTSWCLAYEAIARRHVDSDGRHPQHTWFYRAEYPNLGCLQALSASVFRGFGEVEFHLHHGHDNQESFVAKLRAGLAWFNQVGAMLSAEPQPRQRFGYIAGNWALDNGAGDDALSGCNTELIALRRAGCYADFTFPALGSRAQPRKTNALYYAADDPGPKSYDTGVDCRVGGAPSGDLLLVQGPLVLDWARGGFEDGALETFAPPAPQRLDLWLKAHVHVHGRPEWVFVKLHTHGMQSRSAFLSADLDALFASMNSRWNRRPFRLHYVTAREAYNIIRAAEAGHAGNPDQFRDFDIAAPANRRIHSDAPWRLLHHGADHVALEILGPGPVCVTFAEGPLRSVSGRLHRLEAWFGQGRLLKLAIRGEAPWQIDSSPPLVPEHSGQGVGDGVTVLLPLEPDATPPPKLVPVTTS
jgi:hypothetical protein